MKKIINILSVGVLIFVFAISINSVSAQTSGCVTVSGVQYCAGVNGAGNNNIPLCSQVPAGTTCRPDSSAGGVYNPGVQGQVGNSDLSFFQNLIGSTGSIVQMLPRILIGIAVVVFFAYLIIYLIGGSKPEEKKKHLKGMMYSLLAIFVMVCLWGIIYFVASTLNINLGGTVPAPQLPY